MNVSESIKPGSDKEMPTDGAWSYLANVKWPKRKLYHSHEDFVDAVNDIAVSILNRGIPEDLLVVNLTTEIANSSFASHFHHLKKHHDTETVKGVIRAMRDLEWMDKMKSSHERFRELRIGGRECIFEFMKRLERFHHDHELNDGNHIACAQEIKSVFFQGARVPVDIQRMCRMCLDLDLVAMEVAKIMKERHGTTEGGFPSSDIQMQQDFIETKWNLVHMQQQASTPSMPFSMQGHVDFEYNKGLRRGTTPVKHNASNWTDESVHTHNRNRGAKFAIDNQWPFQDHGNCRQHSHRKPQNAEFHQQQAFGGLMQNTVHANNKNSDRHTSSSIHYEPQKVDKKDKDTKKKNHDGSRETTKGPSPMYAVRAPTNMEFDLSCRHIMICLKCRLMNDHFSKICPNRSFCSLCQAEGHHDMDHKRQVARLIKWQNKLSHQIG